jgi:hypothetical protein
MRSLQIRPMYVLATCALQIALTASIVGPAFAQSPQDLKKRCAQLVNFFDYYGVSRGENSDGARNWTRIEAGLECDRGHYDDGIQDMEALLRRKAFAVPEPEVASTPDGRVSPLIAAAPPAPRNSPGQPDQSTSN